MYTNLNNRKTKRYSFRSHRRGAGSFGFDRRVRINKLMKGIDPARFVNKAILGQTDEDFKPKHKFTDFKLSQQLIKSAVADRGYKIPTPIQDEIIPHIINNFDVVGIADTGTGKTAAFLLPLIDKVLKNPKEKVLIISPTRELAMQTELELKKFTRRMRIFSVCCVGGMSIGRQISQLRYNNHFIIGTPGRLKDLIERKIINLFYFNNVVLDEADRMFDMGFIKDTRFIISKMPQKRQTLFFSATISKEIETIIREFTSDPIRVSVKTRDTSKNVDQDIIKIDQGKTKIDILDNLLSQKDFTKVLVFGRTKHGVEKISKILVRKGFKAESIHGNKNNFQRQKALNLFKDNHIQVLVATDVAARGLNLSNVSHVINYDVPATYEDYIHRIGRTGRWNKKGKALTFID